MSFSLYSPAEVGLEIADRIRARRLGRGWTQAELAKRSGIVLVTLKKFERTGQISLERLLLIAAALDELYAFRTLFEPPPARSLDELEARAKGPSRKYGRRAPLAKTTDAAGTITQPRPGQRSRKPARGGARGAD